MLNVLARNRSQIVLWGILSALALLTITPFVWMIATSLKHPADVYSAVPTLIPINHTTGKPYATLDNYSRLISYNIGGAFLNSLFIAAVLIPTKLLLDALAAYAFARIPFPGRDKLFAAVLATIMVPGVALLIPRVYAVKVMGLYDSPWAIIVPGLISAWDIFLMRQFFLTFPKELEESAIIDGAGRLRIFFQMLLPNSRPVLAIVIITSFIYHWNDLLWPLVTLDSPQNYTLPLALAFLQSLNVQPSLIMAGATFAVIPVVIVFLIFQRRILQGIALTGIKG